MIKEKTNRKSEIDITGSQGNAYCLLGYAKSLSKQLNKDYSVISKEMMAGDYEHLLEVFDREFGEYLEEVEDTEEEQRRDEKNGLYPECEDIAN